MKMAVSVTPTRRQSIVDVITKLYPLPKIILNKTLRMIINVGIGFVTGRRQFQNVLRTYINNWLEYGLVQNTQIRIHVLVAYDLKYQNTEIKDYKNINPALVKMIDSITFIGDESIKKEIKELSRSGTVTEKEAALIFGEGYAKKRNSVLYFAIKKKLDKLIFIDDDEYPMAAFKNDQGIVTWMGQSIVGTHLKYNTGADITHGYHCGYISPIPALSFTDALTEVDFRLFIETISNDIVSWENVKTNIIANKGVTYGNKEIMRNVVVKEVEEIKGMKFISGANICFNLNSHKKFPPFFNPPGARGEDTFMSTCLSNFKVVKVPCYAFHDGFSTYNNILNGVLPVRFFAVDSHSPAVINRFVKAAIGWIRYKPLLLYITQPENYKTMIAAMKSNLHAVIPKFAAYFGVETFHQLLSALNTYDKNVKKHFALFEETKRVWLKIT
jgi:hypothetical protein